MNKDACFSMWQTHTSLLLSHNSLLQVSIPPFYICLFNLLVYFEVSVFSATLSPDQSTLYVADSVTGMYIVDISDITAPLEVTHAAYDASFGTNKNNFRW